MTPAARRARARFDHALRAYLREHPGRVDHEHACRALDCGRYYLACALGRVRR